MQWMPDKHSCGCCFLISWSFESTVWYREYRGNTCDIVHLSCVFVQYREYREYRRIKCCTKFAPKSHQHSTPIQLDKLELAYFLSGKKVITAPTIPTMPKIKDHLKLKSKNGAFPKPSIKRMLTKISAIPCSCFFIQSHSSYNIFYIK